MSKFFVACFCLFMCSEPWARKYAVIVNGGDNGQSGANIGTNGNVLRQHFNQLARMDAELYRARGYEVIVIDANSGADHASFTRAIRSLQNADELAVGIYAHGQLLNGGAWMPGSGSTESGARVRFPRGHVRPDEFETRSGFEMNNTSNRFAYFMAGSEGRANSQIGLGDLYDALAVAKLNNPQMVTSINSLSCYGGNAIRALESIPDTQVFSASDTTAPSYMLFNGSLSSPSTRLVDYSQLLLNALSGGLSYLEAHLAAKRAYDDFALWEANGNTTTRPVNSLELLFADMCLGPPPPTELATCSFESIVPVGVQGLSRNVAQINLHQFMSSSLNEERRFWAGISAAECTNALQGTMAPASLNAGVKREIENYFNVHGITGANRDALNSWPGCTELMDCSALTLRERFMPAGTANQSPPFPIPDRDASRALLRTTCPFMRSPSIPDSQQQQLDCILRHGNTRPSEAIAMLESMMSQYGERLGRCERARTGIAQTNQLFQCLNTLSSRGDDNFWNEVSNLLSLGQRVP